jgi:hypothetical protein
MNQETEWSKEFTERTWVTGYAKGYGHGREDMRKQLTIELWDYRNKILNIDSDLAETIEITIDRIEKLK